MTSVSVSRPQVTLLQPKTSAVTTAVPFLKTFLAAVQARRGEVVTFEES
jgi:hypothetical protein